RAGAGLPPAAAATYAAYILASAGQLERTHPLALAAVVATAAAATSGVGGIVGGGIAVHAGRSAFLLVGAVGLVAVGGMTTFAAGIGKLGPSRASIVSAIQPAVTPVLGLLLLGDHMRLAQVAGGALVIGAVVAFERGALPLPSWLRLERVPVDERHRLRRTRSVPVAAGTSIVREGASARSFFVIEQGRAVVSRDGRRLRTLGPGDFFGEMALLNGGPRT